MRSLLIFCAAVSLLVLLAFLPGAVFGGGITTPISDILGESLTDLNPAPGAVLPTPAPILIPEIPGETTDKVYPFPGHEIDFREQATSNFQFSDRLSVSPYQVRVVSDDNPNGLPPRTEADVIRIPASALESFSPYVITAKSDGEHPLGAVLESDHLTILAGAYGPGSGKTLFDDFVQEPLPEGVTEPILTFTTPALRFDVIEPPGEVAGAQGIISDYVDVSPITVRFISTDDPALIANLPAAEGVVIENIETGGGVRVALNFTSDAVPEPSTMVLYVVGAIYLVCVRRPRGSRV
jgi:hypothetical protein